MAVSLTSFKPGHKGTGGRPKGSPNKVAGVDPVSWRVHRFRDHTGDSSRFSYAMGDR